MMTLKTKEDTYSAPDPRWLDKVQKQKEEDKRLRRMKAYAIIAEAFDKKGDEVGRRNAADDWREAATDKEAKAAPAFLTWTGRSGKRGK
jgi:hypothetical protein